MFKDSAGTVEQYASQAYKTTGLSANAYMEQATSFAASLVSSLGGDTAKAAESANTALTDMADNSNKMGTSMESIQMAYQGFAKQNYTMLDNLKLGYGGTKTEMQRLLTDAQKITGVKYDISNLNDVYSAIHASILESSARYQLVLQRFTMMAESHHWRLLHDGGRYELSSIICIDRDRVPEHGIHYKIITLEVEDTLI